MTRITKDDVRKLARISAIEISEGELDGLTKHLEAVLQYASSLSEVAQMPHPTVDLLHTVNRIREDQSQSFDTECLLEVAPEREGNFFVVPVIIKHQE